MSTSRGSGGAGNGGGVQPIPVGLRKIVQSLKEIVDNPEAEIYATLKDCNMDPNETVSRLLSQDPFHEVKSKREKKKEGKETTEPRSRSANQSSSRGGKTSSDRYQSRGGSTPYTYSENAPGKSLSKKENGSTPYTSSFSSTPAISGDNRSRGWSDGASAEYKGSSFGTADAVQPGSGWTADAVQPGSGWTSDAVQPGSGWTADVVQPGSGYQSAWSGAPGHVSMADIVKMGRPHNNIASNTPNTSHQNQRFPEDHDAPTTNDEWPSIEKPPAVTNEISVVPEYTVDSEQYQEEPGVPADGEYRPHEAEEFEEEQYDETENYGENYGANYVGSDSISSRNIPEEDSRSASLFENDLYKNMGSYQHQAHDFHEAGEIGASLSSITRNLKQLSVEEEVTLPIVVIPDHLQVQSGDCSHLSFGSFGPKTTLPITSDLEVRHNEANVSSAGHLNNRNSEYYGEDPLGNASDGGLFHRNSASAGSYEPSSISQQQEELKPENAEVAHGNQYSYPPNTGYTFDGAQHLNASFSQASSQMENRASFSNDMQSYTNSLPSALSPANAHASRESELQFSQFPVTQSMATKYGNLASAIGATGISVSEALKTAAGFSSTLPSAPQAQTLSGTATGPPLPQHLVHPYSQAALQLGGPYANMIGYPFLPQSYTYVPSAFQQTYAGANSTYHQSLAALLPQYKNNVSASSLPQSAAAGYGGGAFGNTTTVPGNFQMNQSAAAPPSATNLSYEDVLSSQYKDNSHLIALQQQQQQQQSSQNENSGMWLHGLNSRTVPSSTYYNYQQQVQNQQTGGGFRQGQQQQSQNYGTHGYPNYYHSQGGGMSLDQQQNPRDGSLGGSQGQPKQSQLWQNGY